jgi:hypothetical protein
VRWRQKGPRPSTPSTPPRPTTRHRDREVHGGAGCRVGLYASGCRCKEAPIRFIPEGRSTPLRVFHDIREPHANCAQGCTEDEVEESMMCTLRWPVAPLHYWNRRNILCDIKDKRQPESKAWRGESV